MGRLGIGDESPRVIFPHKRRISFLDIQRVERQMSRRKDTLAPKERTYKR